MRHGLEQYKPASESKGLQMIAAIVMIMILVGALCAWLGFRAGYRRGWQARDQQQVSIEQ